VFIFPFPLKSLYGGEFDCTFFSDGTCAYRPPNGQVFYHCSMYGNFFLSNEFLISAITKIQLLTDIIFWFVLT